MQKDILKWFFMHVRKFWEIHFLLKIWIIGYLISPSLRAKWTTSKPEVNRKWVRSGMQGIYKHRALAANDFWLYTFAFCYPFQHFPIAVGGRGRRRNPCFDIVSVNDLKINYMCGMCKACQACVNSQLFGIFSKQTWLKVLLSCYFIVKKHEMWSYSIKFGELRYKNKNNTFMIKRNFT